MIKDSKGSYVKALEVGEWEVSDIVTAEHDQCPVKCKLICDECNICICMYLSRLYT